MVETLEQLNLLAATAEGFYLHSDLNNLIFTLYPFRILPDLSFSTVLKVLHWCVLLFPYNYKFLHICVEGNMWADFVGLWPVPPFIPRVVIIPALPSSTYDDLDWSTSDNVSTEQCYHNLNRLP